MADRRAQGGNVWLGRKLGEILVEEGLASQEEVDAALAAQSRTGKRLGEVLDKGGTVLPALAWQRGLHYTENLEVLRGAPGSQLEPHPGGLLEGTTSRESVAWILGRRAGRLVVAISDPSDTELRERLWAAAEAPLEIVVSPAAVIRAQALAARPLAEAPTEESIVDIGVPGEAELDIPEEVDPEEISEESLRDARFPVARVVNWLLYEAVREGASDIHLEARGPRGVSTKFRIDGVLVSRATRIRPGHLRYLISRIKVLAELDIAESRVPQDGRFRARVSGRDIDFRVSILPTIHGEAAVLRILDTKSQLLGLDSLGMTASERALFLRNIRKPYGMVLVSGPTGSGKTTTLYAALQTIYREAEKFITIEDPVEYELPGVTQIPVNPKRGLTFAGGLRSIVRQDPDKILVGEIRDAETASVAINAAMTGHLVLSSIHSNNVIDSIGRLGYLGIDPYQFASSFNLVMAQRLVRLICETCKVAHKPDDDELVDLGLDPALYRGDKSYFQSAGCTACQGTGYRGRRAIFEMAAITDDIRDLIIRRESLLRIRDAAKAGGMVELRQACRRLVDEGLTSLSELNRVTLE